MTNKTEVLTLAERVFEQIQTAVVKGDIAPGARISEQYLADRFGVSRGPLREAMRRLEARKLIKKIPHAGATVVDLSLEELIEIYQVRESLEALACKLAAQEMTEEEIAELKQVLQKHEQQNELQEGIGYYQKEGDLDFHYRIVQGSKNQVLIDLLCGDLYHLVRMYRYQFSTSSSRPKKAFLEHHRIIEAIESRDSEMAEILMKRHIASSRENVEQRLANERITKQSQKQE